MAAQEESSETEGVDLFGREDSEDEAGHVTRSIARGRGRARVQSEGRGKGKGKGKGRGRGKGKRTRHELEEVEPGPSRGRKSRGRGQTRVTSSDREVETQAGVRRGGSRRGRGRSKTRMCRQDQERVLRIQAERKEELQARVERMEVTELRALVVAVLERQPGMVFDLLEVPPPSPPSQGALGWCICGNCRAMPSDEEKLCCRCQPRNCIAKTPEMQVIVLDPWIIDVANRMRGDMLALDVDGQNKSMRHGAYRQFTLWRHGRLGRTHRRVIPSCCVWEIRDAFPDSNNHYTGYQPFRLV